MGGFYTTEEAKKFSERIKKLLDRDQRRKDRRKKKKKKVKVGDIYKERAKRGNIVKFRSNSNKNLFKEVFLEKKIN